MESFFRIFPLSNFEKKIKFFSKFWQFENFLKLSDSLQTWYTGGVAHSDQECVKFLSKFGFGEF